MGHYQFKNNKYFGCNESCILSLDECSDKDNSKLLLQNEFYRRNELRWIFNKEGVYTIETIIQDLDYRNGMDVNTLLKYLGENYASSNVLSLDEMLLTSVKICHDKVEDDRILIEPLPATKQSKRQQYLIFFLLKF